MSKQFTFLDLASVLRVEGGDLFWIARRGSARAGKRAGRFDRYGYITLRFDGVDLLAHRVIWLLTHGRWPDGQIDHKDGCRSKNLPSNLRECNNSENRANTKPNGKFKGVVRLPHGRYQAQCGKKYLGSYDTEVEAAFAYDAEAVARYGEFARPNFGGAA